MAQGGRPGARKPHGKKAVAKGPDCFACVSFYVTHETPHRYGCRYFSMKAPVLPSIAVRNSSGKACQAFEAKPTPRR